MKIAILTNEYPPHVYGGAGVHVEYLSRELARLAINEHEVLVFCFGEQAECSPNLRVVGVRPDSNLAFESPNRKKVLDPLLRNLAIAGISERVDIIHCHTWYTHFAGCMLKQLLCAPLILTTHSLEPHRPWKREQLGVGYNLSAWLERTAYQNADGVIAVSESMKRDVHQLYGAPLEKTRVIHNGIDPDFYKPTPDPELLASYGVDPGKPFVLFVGRITRQKGIIHLINAVEDIDAGAQVVLCAGSPDTEEIEREIAEGVERVNASTDNRIIWIPQFLPKEHVVSFYSHAAAFVCPSVYEPFGIINLEAMACGAPVVASAVGGIPEIVVPNETGFLVPFEPRGENEFEPRDPEKYSRDMAKAVNVLLRSPEKRMAMAKKGRKRVEEHFSWKSIARKTLAFYEEVLSTATDLPPTCPIPSRD